MTFVLDFIGAYFSDLLRLWSVLVVLCAFIVGLGIRIGRLEGWNSFDSIYFAFITATSVGYGDFRPTKHRSKALAILIALIGVVLVGLIVSIGLHALVHAARESRTSIFSGG